MVHEPVETLSGATKRASRLAKSKMIKNQKALHINWATRSIEALTTELTTPLKEYVARLPPPSALHPFESELLELSVRHTKYIAAVQDVAAFRKTINTAGKEWVSRAAKVRRIHMSCHIIMRGIRS